MLFKGCGNLEFTPGVKLADSKKQVIHAGSYTDPKSKQWVNNPEGDLCISPQMIDWDGDGDLDLFMGCRGGKLALRLNEGTRDKPSFSTTETYVTVKGKATYEKRRRGSPYCTTVADWDGDGLLDILIGQGLEGKVVWHRNIGKKTKPDFDEALPLLEYKTGGKSVDFNRMCVTDVNGDKLVDLVIGRGYYCDRPKVGASIFLRKSDGYKTE